jgi:hypothetical protein
MADSYENVPRREPDADVPRWDPAANVPRWQPPLGEAPGVGLDDEPATPRPAAITRVSPLARPFAFWRAHPWLVVWLCVFLAPAGAVLLRIVDEWGEEALVELLQWGLLALFAAALVRAVLFSARRSATRLGVGVVAALSVAAVLLWPMTQITLGRVICPSRAGSDLGVPAAAVALQAWKRGEAGSRAWRGGDPDASWRETARTIKLLDYQRIETGCFDRLAPVDAHRTWHDFRVTIREGERPPLSKLVVVHTETERDGWKITGIEGPLP